MPPMPNLAAIGVALMLGAATAAAAPAAPTPPTEPRWEKQPTPAQYHAVLPPEAVRIGGRAIIRCHVDDAGLLSACATVTETPSGSGYGQAIASLAPQFKMNPAAMKTEASNGTVVIVNSTFRHDTDPTWVRKPTREELMVVWPKAAWSKGVGGRATINCLVTVQGALHDCVPTSEAPAGEGFGLAAVALTPQFLMTPATRGGEPVTSAVNIPVAFNADGLRGGGRGGDKVASPAMDWPEAPSYADVAAAYPRRAREAHLGGRATLTCKFNNAGRLTNCQVIAEEPKGQGFGFAAQALAQKFRAYPKTSDGHGLLGVDVEIPFVFDPAILSGTKPAIGTPQWMVLPTGAQTGQAFDAVIKAGTPTVRVTLTCTVQPGCSLSGCSVTREDPPGKGVGAAALSLTPLFKVSTWTVEGLPTVGGAINIPLRYEGAPPPPAAP